MTLRVPIIRGDPEPGAFVCAFCRAYAHQRWSDLLAASLGLYLNGHRASVCSHCGKASLWVDDQMVYPFVNTAPAPAADLPDNVRADYQEAADIYTRSPRGAAALLRLCIQKLCKELGLPGKDINRDIGQLVKQGLDTRIQMALDVVRVVGNNAVHPGEMDLRDDQETALKLFALVNLIVQAMITQPKEIEGLYGDLPEGARKGIEKRDAAKPA